MPNYRRPRVPGATWFFTVALAARGGDLLVREVNCLRAAVRATRAERPFRIDAMVVLPDHLHCVWTLPEGDVDFSSRWGAIKARFTRAVREGGDGGMAGWNPALQAQDRRAGFHPAMSETPPQTRRAGFHPASTAPTRKGDAGLWQRRFWEHLIRNEGDLARHLEYCWINPVKHGLVSRACDWPHSTFHREVRCGIVPDDWAGAFPDGPYGEPVRVR